MIFWRDILKTAVALGTFDGLHSGHRAVLEYPTSYSLTVITFDIPPKSVIFNKNDLIMAKADREKALYELGAKRVVFLDFNKVKDTSAEDFLDYIYKEFSPRLILCGYDFRFGKDALGNTTLIENFCKEKDILFSQKSPVLYKEKPISSTLIRNLIAHGNIEEANSLMYKNFRFTSAVVDGDKRGRTLGFPTVNQVFPKNFIKPKFGVYASRVLIDGKEYNAVTNIGIRPTYKTDGISCETHIFRFNKEIYGKEITLNLIKFIREEIKFKDTFSLINAINNDIKTVKVYFNTISEGDNYEKNG